MYAARGINASKPGVSNKPEAKTNLCMSYKSMKYVLVERKLNIGPNAGQVVTVAHPTGRGRFDFRNFCERVAKSTTFSRQEVEAVLNYATEIARDIVTNGDIVDFGDLGTLYPTFRSKAVPKGEDFSASKHIDKPTVKLSPSKKYFTLNGVTFEKVTANPTKPTETPESGSTTTPEEGGNTEPGASDPIGED